MTQTPGDLPSTASPQQYVTEVNFLVRLTRSPLAEPEDITEGYVCDWDSIDVPLEEAARLTTAVAWNRETGHSAPFVAQQKYSQFEWGASGSTVQFIVDMVNNAGSELILAGLGYAVARIRGSKPDDPTQGLIGDLDSGQTRAVEAVTRVFSCDRDSLRVIEATADDDAMLFRITGDDGREFSAAVSRLDTGVPYVHVTRLPE